MNRPRRELELTAQRQRKGATVRDARRAEHRRATSAPSPVRVQSAKAASFLACSERAGPHAEGTEAVAGYPQLDVRPKSEPVSRDPVLPKQG